MLQENDYRGGENFDLKDVLIQGRKMKLRQRTKFFSSFLKELMLNKQMQHLRCVSSAADREVEVFDNYTGELKKMLMFGSNNYLGLANHPKVKEYVIKVIKEYGVGIGGPPLLNGYTHLHRELEERLAHLKGDEGSLIFSSGYGANVGLVTALTENKDFIIYDSHSHASFYDGIKMSGTPSIYFKHNDVEHLEHLLFKANNDNFNNIYVGVEGVYSMDGDIAPLDKIKDLCNKYNATLIIDDAHGSGVMGKKGSGTAEHFGLHANIDITMGTFSKTFAVTGGFVTASKEVINYLRFFARSYMFSASIPPTIVASVLAGLEIMDNEPQYLIALRENINYTANKMREIGLPHNSITPIFPIIVSEEMNIREASLKFHDKGIFVNSVEYPAVPKSQERFRISVMATHTKEDIDRLFSAFEEIWDEYSINHNSVKGNILVSANKKSAMIN